MVYNKFHPPRGIVNPKKDDIDLYFKGFLKEATNMEILQG